MVDVGLLDLLMRELSARSGRDLQAWLDVMLQRKLGPNEWPAGPIRDGGIDYLVDGVGFQVYGSESPYGRADHLRKKVEPDVVLILQTAASYSLQIQKIIFLTNVKATKEMVSDIQRWRAQDPPVEILNLRRTSEYLYDVFFPFAELDEYHKPRVTELRTDWPYSLDEHEFVRLYEYRFGPRYGFHEHVLGERDMGDVVSALLERLRSQSVVLLGYYGMGKTTIARYMFEYWHDFARANACQPVFLDLKSRKLEDYSPPRVWRTIANDILRVLSANEEACSDAKRRLLDNSMLPELLEHMHRSGRLVLLLDGIDESFADIASMTNLLRFMSESQGPILLTSRLEFGAFRDVAARHPEFDRILWVEVEEWEERQWSVYERACRGQDGASDRKVTDFFRRVRANEYGDLPKRPLFLKMLVDLETRTDRHHASAVGIDPRLRGNLAEVYHRFIDWKLADDLVRKANSVADEPEFSTDSFLRDARKVLHEVAKEEYWFSRREEEQSTRRLRPLTLADVERITANLDLEDLTGPLAKRMLRKSSLFSMLALRKDSASETLVSFSHKSFGEYLFAFNLADCLLVNDTPRESIERVWGTFQTHEVSRHFLNELQRRTVVGGDTHNAIAERIHEYLATYTDWVKYDELTEEFLYYSGRLRLKDPRIERILRECVEQKDACEPTYYRTASLALSWTVNPSFCEGYVLGLLNDRQSFELNRDIQIRYYTESRLREVLARNIREFIDGERPSEIMALEVFTYFTAVPPEGGRFGDSKQALDETRRNLQRIGQSGIVEICARIPEVWQRGW